MAAVLSSPHQMRESTQMPDSLQRTSSRCIAPNAPRSPTTPSSVTLKLRQLRKQPEVVASPECPVCSSPDSLDSLFNEEPEAKPKTSVTRKADEMQQQAQERRELIGEITRLDPFERYDWILQEFDFVKLRMEMQSKAIDAFQKKSLQDMKMLQQRIRKMDLARSSAAPVPCGDGGAEVKKDSKALTHHLTRVEAVEEEGKRKFVQELRDGVAIDGFSERVEEIEAGIEEVRVEFGKIAGVLDFGVEKGGEVGELSVRKRKSLEPCEGTPTLKRLCLPKGEKRGR